MKQTTRHLLLFITFLGATQTALAHMVFAEPKAVAGSYYKATMRVGHGCQGAATTGITVFVPDGFQGAKPQPKAGWRVTTRKTQLAQPYTSHGKTITEDVTEISWKADNAAAALPDAFYDEFSWMVRLPNAPTNAWVRVLQTCAQGQHDWSAIPASGLSTQGLASPALLLVIEPPVSSTHHH
ncbi:MAG: hypothetical protein RLZZ24_769 [Pseudomonadota bacterium]